MTAPNLRERVAKAMVAKDSGPEGSLLFKLHWQEFAEGYLTSADAAIAIVLEEAAKVCDRYAKHDWKLGEGFRSLAGIELAADIRALKEKT
jgi:hypothetical protein